MAKKPTVSRAQVLQLLKTTTKGAWKEASKAPPTVKGQRLPGDLVNAVARFSSFKLGKDVKGHPYVAFTGIVCEPTEFNGVRATKSFFFRPPSKTPGKFKAKSIKEKLMDLASDIQLMGKETDGTDEDGLITLLDELQEEKPYFLFNTFRPPATKDQPNPNTFVMVQGLAEDYVPGEEGEEVEEAEAEEAEAPKPSGKKKPQPKTPEPEVEEEAEVEAEEEGETEEEEGDFVPELGAIYLYKGLEVKIKSNNEEAQTCDVVRMKDKKIVRNVAFDLIEGASEEQTEE